MGGMQTGKISVDHHFYKVKLDKAKGRIKELEESLDKSWNACNVANEQIKSLTADLIAARKEIKELESRLTRHL
jgi:predicted  nucleic acid-binding Zn-ribbon protein